MLDAIVVIVVFHLPIVKEISMTRENNNLLKISEAQSEVFAIDANKKFRRKLEFALRRDFPEVVATLSDPEITDRIDRGLSLGIEYGMEERDDFIRFSYLYFKSGKDFETDERFDWVRHILNGRASGHMKLYYIEQGAEAEINSEFSK